MNFVKAFNGRFLMVLMTALIVALPVLAKAQAKSDFQPPIDAASGSRHPGGVNVLFGDGSVRFISDGINVRALSIYLPNSPLEYDFVDARDPNAENKSLALFDAAYRSRRGIVVTLAEGSPDISGRASVVNFLANDGGDRKVLAIELKECVFATYQTGGAPAAGVPSESYSLNFTQIKFAYKPQK